ncbi:hypothetical protein IFR05_012575 [Cadophora sp. M221]|nr:hypothetical protein IFR05_012575 [Cadophora sp. M221]
MSPTKQIGSTNDKLRSENGDVKIPKDFELLQKYSDADLLQRIRKFPCLPDHSDIFILSTSLIAKSYRLEEPQDTIGAMEAETQLGVRVPAVKRIVKSGDYNYLIMERIDGVTLEEAWPKLGWFATIRLALQLRWFFYLEDHFMLPPKSSSAASTTFIQFWTSFTSIRQAMKTAAQDPVPSTTCTPAAPATPNTLVFTHHDLAPRNILVDSLGRLWVVDWDYAGFYPRYFEYAAMHNFNVPQAWTRFARARWSLFTWITAGRSEQERKVLESNGTKFTRFRVG